MLNGCSVTVLVEGAGTPGLGSISVVVGGALVELLFMVSVAVVDGGRNGGLVRYTGGHLMGALLGFWLGRPAEVL
ncbi:hypothetical protein ABL78_8222 [Leptomonas seymouri]|uniref:Uncharacterized protein n=1 Tax=Leptomonas seymouri TaxID=5684 RepID=A0A0N1PBT3_LEPSE|nr:hypothetical protein ABL78_8222 [Leptomonas seymouri]|eukprot:KPI82764.1 hypothetical protein ABL78_8222 [Leptomonas seymouri]